MNSTPPPTVPLGSVLSTLPEPASVSTAVCGILPKLHRHATKQRERTRAVLRSLLTGKSTGNFAAPRQMSVRKRPETRGLHPKFLTDPNREFSILHQGNNPPFDKRTGNSENKLPSTQGPV